MKKLFMETTLRFRSKLRLPSRITPGLYACGTDSIGVFFTEETGYIDYGGVAHGWCFTSGKIAGENAAAYGMQMNKKAEAE